jgi:hypothetical protein
MIDKYIKILANQFFHSLVNGIIHLHLVFLACIFPFLPRLASLIFVARASTPTLKTASYAG